MADAIAIDSKAAIALLAAAASSAPSDTDPAAWERTVMARAESLLRCVPALVERSAVLAATKAVRGVIASVDEVKGRGVITSHATIGTPQRGQEVVNGRGVEHFRTQFLNTPEGEAMFDLAKSLIGRHCRFGKRVEEYTDAGGQAGKVSMVEWIEDIGPDPLLSGDQSAPRSAPAPRQAPNRNFPRSEAAAPTEDWFQDNGWRDQAQHDETRQFVRDALAHSDKVAETWKTWATAYAVEHGFALNAAWPNGAALRLKAKLLELIDAEEERTLASVGAPADYGDEGRPF